MNIFRNEDEEKQRKNLRDQGIVENRRYQPALAFKRQLLFGMAVRIPPQQDFARVPPGRQQRRKDQRRGQEKGQNPRMQNHGRRSSTSRP